MPQTLPKTWKCAVAAALAGSLLTAGPIVSATETPGAGNPPAGQGKPVPPRVHPVTGAKLYALGPGLAVDKANREIYLEAKTCLDSGILEFLLVQGSRKAYESAFTTAALPSQLMAAMLLLDWKTGDPLRITLLAGRDTLSPREFLERRDPDSRDTLRWLLAGSNYARMGREGFLADQEGILVSLVERSEAVVGKRGDVRNPYHSDRFGYAVRRTSGRKPGYAVTFIFRREQP